MGNFLGFNWFHRVLLNVIESWILLFFRFYQIDWFLIGWAKSYWVLLGFTGFYWVLLGFTGLYHFCKLGIGGFRQSGLLVPNLRAIFDWASPAAKCSGDGKRPDVVDVVSPFADGAMTPRLSSAFVRRNPVPRPAPTCLRSAIPPLPRV